MTAIAQAVAGFCRHAGAMAAVLALAGAAVAAVHAWPAFAAACARLAAWRADGGLWASMLLMGVCGGALPWLLRAWRDRDARDAREWGVLAYWTWRGADLDLLYRAQAAWFGDRHDAATLLAKTAFDMLVFVPGYVIPLSVAVFAWRDRVDLGQRGALGRALRERGPAALLACWMLWIPATLLIYAMPLPAQLPLCALVVLLWSLVLGATARPRLACSAPAPTPAP